jgi:hypothetical protein
MHAHAEAADRRKYKEYRYVDQDQQGGRQRCDHRIAAVEPAIRGLEQVGVVQRQEENDAGQDRSPRPEATQRGTDRKVEDERESKR